MATRIGSKPRSAPKSGVARTVPATIGDNSVYREEEERVQLISFVSKLTQADIDIEKAKAPLKVATDSRKKIVNLAKAAGFTAEELRKRMEEMNASTRDMPVQLARENRHRRWLGITSDEQTEIQLGDKVPPEAKDEAHWKGEGYKAGLRLMSSTPPPGCPERFVQAYMLEHERGHLETTSANAPKQMGVRGQAAADFKSDNPEVDVEKAARKLKGSAFMERGKVVEVVDPGSSAPAVEVVHEADDGFEATPEELAAQVTRPVRDETGEVV